MIVVRFDSRRLNRAGVNRHSVIAFFDINPQLAKLCRHGCDAVSLFVPIVFDVANRCRSVGEHSHGRQGLSRIADRVHVDVDPLQRLTLNRDGRISRRDNTTHLLKRVDKVNVALQSVPAKSLNRDSAARNRRRRKEVAGRRRIRFDRVIPSGVQCGATEYPSGVSTTSTPN